MTKKKVSEGDEPGDEEDHDQDEHSVDDNQNDESENDQANYDFDQPDNGQHDDDDKHHDSDFPKKVHRLDLTKTQDFNAALRKRGVVYLSRIPPRMNPTKVKQLLSIHGNITRLYLAPEDASVRKRRRKVGGSGAKRYTEGWVEFEQKKVAKRVAASLNNTPISNHKRNVHCGDLWNVKYLHKFQWQHLTEKVAYERRVREQKLRLEMLQARKEQQAFVRQVEKGQVLDKIEQRKRKRGEQVATPTSRKAPRQTKVLDGEGKATKKALLESLV
jgi:ESF2/ABP1 family protein